MRTLLFDHSIGKVISRVFENGYLVDSLPQSVNPPIYELEYKPTSPPPYDSELQVVSAVWIPDIVLKTYTQVWSVRDKTNEERIAEINAKAEQKESELNPVEIKSALQLTIGDLPESDQVNYISTYPAWKVHLNVLAGEKYQYNGFLFKVVQAHTTQLDWSPDIVPALFVRVAAPDEIPVWKQPTGSTDAYMIGDKVHFPTISDPVYESLIDFNVWSPIAYPAGWKTV